MAQNAAEQIIDETTNEAVEIAQPMQRPIHTSVPLAQPKKITWSKFEKVLVSSCSLVLTFMMVMLVATKIAATNSQHKLQNVNTTISKVNNSNTSTRQVINELTSQSHLEKVAQKSGLTISNTDIRNVNK
ncbi:cell division protein FtsL [Paucilactobacillus kaifaensis]|uniref:cell division protein FtsL n=1 Tax=Paucilactobacillus kaifaensis TaxID=2559921 RepID=UPI0010F48BF5|nr:cell division protein FtsL [Paucilactobacillus kaifaensis]